jgi:hypothetical protein
LIRRAHAAIVMAGVNPMGVLSRLREELEELSIELEDAATVPDAAIQPEISRAQTAIVEARDALSSAFLSRRAMILARESIARADASVKAALAVSSSLRTRSASLKSEAAEIRSAAADARTAAAVWRTRLDERPDAQARVPGTVEIESAIPEGHPQKGEIESTITRTLSAAGGRWRAWITVPAGGTWWGLRVHGPNIEWVETLQGAEDQTPAAIAGRLEPLMRIARAEALYLSRLGRRAVRVRRETATD